MARRLILELKDGDNVDETFLVADRQLRANRNAALYLNVDLRDKSGVINGRMWNVSEESVAHIQAGQYVRVRGKVQLFQGVLQLILTGAQPIDAATIDPLDFLPETTANIEQLMSRLREHLLKIESVPLRTLCECCLLDEELMEKYAKAPAGIKAHHAYHGGLLEHVVTLMDLARKVVEVYPTLDADLLVSGVFWHDIGKLRELSYETSFAYTDEGQLIGHLQIGVEMLSERIRETEQLSGERFPEELSWRLKHLILSHHGSYEFGSPRLPMTPEAMALHLLDNLDAKLHEFMRAISEDPHGESHWTLFLPRLDRKLYKTPTDASKRLE